jgi:hypothetical protein
MFQTEAVEKIKTRFVFSACFPRKISRLWDNEEERGGAGQDTGDSVTRRMRVASWITRATETHSEYVILLFYGNNG